MAIFFNRLLHNLKFSLAYASQNNSSSFSPIYESKAINQLHFYLIQKHTFLLTLITQHILSLKSATFLRWILNPCIIVLLDAVIYYMVKISIIFLRRLILNFSPFFLELPFLHTWGLSHFTIGQLQLYNPFLALTTTTPSHINLSSMPLIRNILSKSSINRKQNSVAKSFVLT